MQIGWRLTEVRHKTLYVVSGWAASAVIFFVARTWLVDAHSWAYAAIAFVLNLIYVLLAVRIFRGYREPVEPPRPLWRWTGRPKAGFWLGGLHALGVLGAFLSYVQADALAYDKAPMTLTILSSTLIAAGYVNSSLRLSRHPELWSEQRPPRSDESVS